MKDLIPYFLIIGVMAIGVAILYLALLFEE